LVNRRDRRVVLGAAIVAAVGGAVLVAVIREPERAAVSGGPGAPDADAERAAPAASATSGEARTPDRAALLQVVVAESSPFEDRARALEALASDAEGIAALAAALEEDAGAPAVRAQMLTALGRRPHDPAARRALLRAVEPGRPRDERLLALSVLASAASAAEHDEAFDAALEGLESDPDAAVRAKVQQLRPRR
jgi:hypothetical protein